MSDREPVEYPEIIEYPSNWIRCIVLRDKNKEHVANAVLFHDGVIVLHWLTGKTDVYPDDRAATCALGDSEYSWQMEEVRIEP